MKSKHRCAICGKEISLEQFESTRVDSLPLNSVGFCEECVKEVNLCLPPQWKPNSADIVRSCPDCGVGCVLQATRNLSDHTQDMLIHCEECETSYIIRVGQEVEEVYKKLIGG